jgi:hypothetical protein
MKSQSCRVEDEDNGGLRFCCWLRRIFYRLLWCVQSSEVADGVRECGRLHTLVPPNFNWLTPCGCVLVQRPPVAQLLKNFPNFYGSRRFITVFTRALHWSLSSARAVSLLYCICIVFIVWSLYFIGCVILCAVFCLSVVCYFVWCVLLVCSLIVVPLTPGKTHLQFK